MKLTCIVAASTNWGIGINGSLPWSIPGDMSHFKNVTIGDHDGGCVNAVIMVRAQSMRTIARVGVDSIIFRPASVSA